MPAAGDPPRHARSRLPHDTLWLVLFLACWLAVHALCFRSLGGWTGDTGKEFGVPQDLLAGKLLYRDTFWPYGPFPAYLNAALMAVFGTHADVLLLTARLLGLAICVQVYRLVRRTAGPVLSAMAAAAVLALSTTSSYFAIPYSFATLWGTLLGLLGVEQVLRYAEGKPDDSDWSMAWAGLCCSLLLLAKFTIAGTVLVPGLMAIWFRARRVEAPRSWRVACRGLVLLLAPVLLLALPVYAGFACVVRWDSLHLQAFGGFHAHNIRHGLLYSHLWETMLLRDGHGLYEFAAAGLVWGVLAVGALAALCLLPSSAQDRGGGRTEAFLCVVFALLTLLQMNSTCHVPYVFPALLVACVLGLVRCRESGARWLRMAAHVALVVVLLGPVVVGGMRLSGTGRRTVTMETPGVSLRLLPQVGLPLQRTLAEIQKATAPGESVAVLTGHDFLYQILDRPNELGYYYTMYEPFHLRWAEERLLERVRKARFGVLVTTENESFTYAYSQEVPATRRRILDGIFAGYDRVSGEDCRPYVVWRRRP
jgi:4-amino-4-deoxy-L-arabinose transferase-like glycosyltransferase